MMLEHQSKTPLYQQAYSLILNRINDIEWTVGSLLPSENELCADLGISRGTLRQALAILENEGYIRREQGRGTVVIYGNTRKQQADLPDRTLVFIVPFVIDSFAPTLLLSLEHTARIQGFTVIFDDVQNNLEKQAEILKQFVQDRVAGIVIFPVNSVYQDPTICELAMRKYPLVLIDRYVRGIQTDYVTADNFGGGLRGAQHLLSLGHKKIAFLTWSDPSTSLDHRRTGYQSALMEAGIQPEAGMEWEINCFPTVDLDMLNSLLTARSDRPTAILAANELLGLAVYRLCRKSGIRIPEDLALVAFGNLNTAVHLDIPLTTVTLPTYEMGKKAAEIVIGRIQGTISGPQQFILPTKLIVQESSGAGADQQTPLIGLDLRFIAQDG